MNKNVLVSGASSGLGRAVAEYLASNGYNVYAGARSFGNGAEPPALCKGVYLDVTDEKCVKNAVDGIINECGELFALVNCAAFFTMGSCEEVPADELSSILNTNFLGDVRTVQAVLPYFRKQGYGRIINFSSINGLLAIPFQGAYTASKHAVEGWSEALCQETERFGVYVTVIEPGDCRGGSDKYRKKAALSEDASSPYAEYYKAGTEKIHHDESNGMEQTKIAKAVCKLLSKKTPPSRRIVATLTQRSSVWLKKILPSRTFDRIIANYYAPKEKKK